MLSSAVSPYPDYTSGTDESNDSLYPPAVRNGLLTGFVPLPANPAIPLTDDQLDALFSLSHRSVFCRELARLTVESDGDAA